MNLSQPVCQAALVGDLGLGVVSCAHFDDVTDLNAAPTGQCDVTSNDVTVSGTSGINYFLRLFYPL